MDDETADRHLALRLARHSAHTVHGADARLPVQIHGRRLLIPPTTFAWAKQLLGPIAGEHVGARWREVLLPRAYLAHEAAPEVADHHQAAWLGLGLG